MIRPSTEIRSATPDEMPHAVAAIVAAFLLDPAARFAWPAARDYLKAMPLAIYEFAGACFGHGTAYISADFCGTALWLPPGVQPNGEGWRRYSATRRSRSTWTTSWPPLRKWISRIPKRRIGICR